MKRLLFVLLLFGCSGKKLDVHDECRIGLALLELCGRDCRVVRKAAQVACGILATPGEIDDLVCRLEAPPPLLPAPGPDSELTGSPGGDSELTDAATSAPRSELNGSSKADPDDAGPPDDGGVDAP